MTYREQLEKVKTLGIDICKLIIANECDCVFNFEISEKDFERICDFAYGIYLKSEYVTANEIVCCINDLILDDGKTVDEVVAMGKWDFIERANG